MTVESFIQTLKGLDPNKEIVFGEFYAEKLFKQADFRVLEEQEQYVFFCGE